MGREQVSNSVEDGSTFEGESFGTFIEPDNGLVAPKSYYNNDDDHESLNWFATYVLITDVYSLVISYISCLWSVREIKSDDNKVNYGPAWIKSEFIKK